MTVEALMTLYNEAFFSDNKSLYCKCSDAIERLTQSQDELRIRRAFDETVRFFESEDIITKLELFDNAHKDMSIFTFIKNYMRMVFELLAFVKAVRTANWDLHLSSLESFCKYYFAHDKQNYARLIPVYLAEMKMLPENDPDVNRECTLGNWIVNKNSAVAFCGIGADHALEQINRSFKVKGGLVGITRKASSKKQFLLASPALSKLADDAKLLQGITSIDKKHHELNDRIQSRARTRTQKLIDTIRSYENPFIDMHPKLYNIATGAVATELVQKEICNQPEIGRSLFDIFLSTRIKSNDTNLWSKMTKRKLKTWAAMAKVCKVKTKHENKLIELSADRALFCRMIIKARFRRDINLQEVIGTYELSVVPRSLFAPDGTMLHCQQKSVLADILFDMQNDIAAKV